MPFARLNRRIVLVALHDIVMAAVSFQLALGLRYWLADLPWTLSTYWEAMVIFAAVAAVVFRYSGLYRGIWHFASVRDMLAIMRASALALLIFLPLLFFVTRLESYPRSALLLQFFILVPLLGGPRLLYRSWKDGSLIELWKRGEDKRVPVLLVGSGLAADAFIREMERNRQAGYRVVGIIDNSEGRQGRDLRGVRILGGLHDISAVVQGLREFDRPRRIIVADERLGGGAIRQLLDAATPLGLTVARLPRLTEFRKEGETAQQLRPIDVEDLLGRPQRVLNRAPVAKLFAGRRVLVTGAGGTIGSELVRQIAELAPSLVVLFEQSEHALYQIDMEMAERFAAVPRMAVLANVRSRDRIEQVFREYRPEIVLHAAAYKHVPLVEGNAEEGVLTNAIGTRELAEACQRHGVEAMVLISTDKAVNPTNVMGATKRVAEMICQSLDVAQAGTRFVTVRFGNVLGSSGSVVPLFQRQLSQGGPLTVTHPDVTRFFMTTREAVELILQAAALPQEELNGGGKIFVLDMGEPVRIQDLARQMIRLAGLKPDVDVKIVFTGLRPGEKLYEEVLHHDEALVPTSQEGILLAAPRVLDRAELNAALDVLAQAAAARDTATVLAQLKILVPEFRHAPLGQDKDMPVQAATAATSVAAVGGE
ncbi:MAG TPA: nucleoside-diphosphate sugar epimerase/dehydratase [Ferrovibrio sp.]|uniref:polysaccharide biosynthesis protein n=1 Tax=Ferrovibrio sp. TaxID=1917215 RepID=UPI002ED0D7DC